MEGMEVVLLGEFIEFGSLALSSWCQGMVDSYRFFRRGVPPIACV
jgi:hypothetical protein